MAHMSDKFFKNLAEDVMFNERHQTLIDEMIENPSAKRLNEIINEIDATSDSFSSEAGQFVHLLMQAAARQLFSDGFP